MAESLRVDKGWRGIHTRSMWWTLIGAAFAGPLPSIDSPARTGLKSPVDAAVVVGLEDYLLVPNVPHARRDAQAFRDTLVYSRGIPPERVQLLSQGSRESLSQAVDRAVEQVGDGGTVWLYFAGHGAADPATGRRLLLGDDVRPDPEVFAARGLPLDEVIGRIEAKGASGVLVLDTCYGGVSRGGESLVPGSRFLVPSFATEAPPGIVVWTATSADELAMPLEAARHGAFTYFAVGALRGWADGVLDGEPDGAVTVREAQEYVVQALRAAGVQGQRPDLRGDPDRVLLAAAAEPGPDLRSLSDRAGEGTKEIRRRPQPTSPPQDKAHKVQKVQEGVPVAEYRLPVDAAQARAKLQAAASSLGWRVADEGGPSFQVIVPISLTSIGDVLTFTLAPAQGGETAVEVSVVNLSPLAPKRPARARRLVSRLMDRVDLSM